MKTRSKLPLLAVASLSLGFLPAAHGDTGFGISGNVTVDTRGTPSATTITVTGRVLSQPTGLPLGGANVTLAGRSGTTAANGTYSLGNVDLAAGNTLSVSLTGYLSQTQTVSAAATAKSLNVPDLRLTPSSSTKPVVEWVRPDVDGLYLVGFGLTPPLRARVNWNGHTPGSVSFSANGVSFATASGAGPEYSTTLNVDTRFSPSMQAGRNTVSAVATSAGGTASDAAVREFPVLPVPSALSSVVNSSLFQAFAPDHLGFDFAFPPVEQKVTLPPIGTFGFTFGANASFDYTLGDGAWEAAVGVGAEGDVGKRGRRPNFPAVTRVPQTKLYVGNKEFGVTLNAFAAGTATRSTGIVLIEFGGQLAFSGRFEVWRVGLLDVLGPGLTQTFSSLPAVSNALKNASLIFYAMPNIAGVATIKAGPVTFKDATVSGGIGIEAAYEPKIGGFTARFYAGSDVSVAFGYPAPVFRGVEFRLYGGYSVSVWAIRLSKEVVWVDYTYPPGAGLMMFNTSLAAANVALAPQWQAVERPWRENGGETFVLEPESVELDSFRRMGAARPAGAIGTVKPRGGAVTNVIPSDPSLPAQAALPVLTNVFPEAAPALAGRNSELMLLYVRDTGAANPVQFTEIAFTRFDGTNWSTPAAVATDTRGQFAPQVAYDGAGNAVAVWERIKDAAFSGTDLAATAAQMELVTARWNPAAQAWTAPVALTDNAFLDHGARLAGPLADGDLALTWLQNDASQMMGTGAPGAPTNSRVMWRRWDSATATWGAASTLVANLANELSDSLAAAGNQAVFLWSKDGDGNLDDLNDTELWRRVYNASADTWGVETRYTNDAVADKNAKVAVNAAGDVYAVWQRGTELVMDRNFLGTPAAVRTDSASMGFADFALTLGPGGNVLAIWQEMSDAGSDAHYRVFDPISNTWGLDTLLSGDAALERSFAPVWDAMGNLVLAYNNVAITKETKTVALEGGGSVDIPGVPQPGQVDLFAARRALVKDLGFGTNGLTATGTTFLPGDEVALKAKVRNTGNVAVENVQVAFYGGDPAAGGTLIQTVMMPGWLKAADEQEVSVAWTVPGPAAARTVFVVIDPAGQVTEFSETNNTTSLALNGVDLELEYLAGSVLRDGSVRVVARVTNIGAPASPASSLKLWPSVAPGANPLAEVEVSQLNPGESLEIPLDLPAGSHAEGDFAYRLVVDDENLATDIDRTNNETFFALNLFIDDDGDGIARAWEIANGFSDANAADASLDTDGDGFTNRQEFLAGTNPRDANSFLRAGQFNVVQSANGTSFTSTISWTSVPGRLYAVGRSFDLISWVVVADNQEATPPLNTVSDEVTPPDGKVFYRIVAK